MLSVVTPRERPPSPSLTAGASLLEVSTEQMPQRRGRWEDRVGGRILPSGLPTVTLDTYTGVPGTGPTLNAKM